MSEQASALVTFRTKVKYILDGERRRAVIDYKLKVSRSDCSLKPHQHIYYNSDLFPSMLQRAYDRAIHGKRWCYLDSLPMSVTIDEGKFMSTITVRVTI